MTRGRILISATAKGRVAAEDALPAWREAQAAVAAALGGADVAALAPTGERNADLTPQSAARQF